MTDHRDALQADLEALEANFDDLTAQLWAYRERTSVRLEEFSAELWRERDDRAAERAHLEGLIEEGLARERALEELRRKLTEEAIALTEELAETKRQAAEEILATKRWAEEEIEKKQ